MSLVTQCPKCGSEYDVTADQLKLHDGLVRCGHCSHVFDGLACLKDSLPTLTRKAADKTADKTAAKTTDQELPEAATSNKTPVLDVPASPPEVQPPAQSMPAPAPAPDPVPVPVSVSVSVSGPSRDPVQTPPDVKPDDGPFIPSVDRMGQAASGASWRQEPSLTSSKSSDKGPDAFSAKSSRREVGRTLEPTLGSAQAVDSTPGSREPSLGALLDNDGQQWGVGSQSDPSVKVIGESRLRGDDPSATGRAIPEFLEDEELEPTATRVYWILGSMLLALVLMVQSLVVFRHDIVATVPSLRPLLVTLCGPLSCEVSYVRQVERIFTVGSTLQQDPNANVAPNQRAYDLRLTLQNRGAYPQPWPALMVTLTDASGTPVIRRALMPSEFLPAELLDGPFRAGQEVGLDIPLRVDGLSISGFELKRFFP